MYIFNVISLLGGLALFLYGMRLMGNNLKEGSSGTLKVVMEKVTNNPIKAFLLGVAVTAVIQSSTATIVITSGLVAAGIISLNQSLGIIVGANVGTTVTGQIIRLLDIDSGGNMWLRFFQPSTLAPIALIIGVAFLMFFKFNKSDNIGGIAIGFGILFTGLLNMTAAVSTFAESGIIDVLFTKMGDNPILGYLVGAGVAFVLQSSSATIGILQAFSLAGGITFKTVYVVIVGVYLGDCVTTAIVCSIGAKADARRVGIINIIFNLCKTALVIIFVTVLHKAGFLGTLWEKPLHSGGIANANTIFNIACSIVMLPFIGFIGRLSKRIIKDEAAEKSKYAAKIDALNPVFFSTPALAFRSAYEILSIMLESSIENVKKAMKLLSDYDEKIFEEISDEEKNIDYLADCTENYLVRLSPYISEDLHIKILDQYYKMITDFERLGDHAMNIAESAQELNNEGLMFSNHALDDLEVTFEILVKIFEHTKLAFEKRSLTDAQHIEPLEEVVDDLVNTLHDNHLKRLREGKCSIRNGMIFLDVLSNIERISDTCSNVGVAIVVRASSEDETFSHNYISALHQGKDAQFNKEYNEAHDVYYKKLKVEEK